MTAAARALRPRAFSIAASGVWVALAVLGGIGVVERFVNGHALADYGSYVPWGLWVAAYMFFGGLSAGAFLVASLVYVFGVRSLERIARPALFVAAIAIVMALVTISFDLGHLERLYLVYARPQAHSTMAWMVWLYTAYFVVLLGALFFALRRDLVRVSAERAARDDRMVKLLATAGVPLVIAFAGGVGAELGTVIAREAWHTSIYPILSLADAIVSGAALMTAVAVFFSRTRDAAWADMVRLLGRLVLGLVLLDVLLEWAEYSIPMWDGIGSKYQLLRHVLFGPYWYVFWLVHMLLGVAVPIVLLTFGRRRPAAIGTAAALVAVTFFAVRLNLVIPGLVTPQLEGLQTAYLDPIGNRLSFDYLPSLFEWQVLAGVVAAGVAAFFVGYRLLPLMPRGAGPQPATVLRSPAREGGS
jgi:protein NrfD